MDYDETSLQELYDESCGGRSASLVERLISAVNWCDAHALTQWGVRLRDNLINHTGEKGQSAVALVALSRLLSAVDREPDLEGLLIDGNHNRLMWYLKWIAVSVAENPAVSRPQIEGLLGDMGRRYAARGLSQSTVEYITMRVMYLIGDLSEARRRYELWKALPADQGSDCRACVVHAMMQLMLREGALDAAIAHARPVLDGAIWCRDVPGCSYADLLIPLLKAGRLAEADRYQRRGQRAAVDTDGLELSLGQHLQFLALTDQLKRAASLLRQTFAQGNDSPEAMRRMYYLMGAWTVMERMLAAGKDWVQLLPVERLPLQHKQHRSSVAELRDWSLGEIETIPARFDARNGNDMKGQRVAEMKSLASESFPLPGGTT